jgi:hypothetical protein
LKPSPAQIGELRQYLHGFLIFHLGRLPRGRAAALAAGQSGAAGLKKDSFVEKLVYAI